MRPSAQLILAAVVALVPVAAASQSAQSDLAYCRALSQVYIRYIGHDWQWGNKQMFMANNDAQVAVARCEQGDAAGAIPILERELRTNKFTLPPRG